MASRYGRRQRKGLQILASQPAKFRAKSWGDWQLRGVGDAVGCMVGAVVGTVVGAAWCVCLSYGVSKCEKATLPKFPDARRGDIGKHTYRGPGRRLRRGRRGRLRGWTTCGGLRGLRRGHRLCGAMRVLNKPACCFCGEGYLQIHWLLTVGFVVGCDVGGKVGSVVGVRVGASVGCVVGVVCAYAMDRGKRGWWVGKPKPQSRF